MSMVKSKKSKFVAAFLAFFLGGLGIHKFYLGKAVWGLIYFGFSWTGIPMILGIIEGVIYLLMPEKSFALKYS